MGGKLQLNPAEYQAILDMTSKGLSLADRSRGINSSGTYKFVPGEESSSALQYNSLVNHLMHKYKLHPDAAVEFAKRYMRSSDPESLKMREEGIQDAGHFRYEYGYADPMSWNPQIAVDNAKSEKTVSAFVLGGVEKAKYGQATPATQVMLQQDMQNSNPYPVTQPGRDSKGGPLANYRPGKSGTRPLY